MSQVKTAALLGQASGRFAGTNLLWLEDPDKPRESAAEVQVEGTRIRYTWSFDGRAQSGSLALTLGRDGVEAEWSDTWHSPQPMAFAGPHSADAVVVRGNYSAGEGPEWGWRIEVRSPAPERLSIEMFNIHPDGQEDIAVRLEAQREAQ